MTTLDTPIYDALGDDDMYVVHLKRGLPATKPNGPGGQPLKFFYKTVRLCETDMGDERAANRLSERVVLWLGEPRLLQSEVDFKFALTMQHIERFEAGHDKLHKGEFDMATVLKLHPSDWALIETKVYYLNLHVRLRYGEISQAEYDRIVGGKAPAQAPQPQGPAADAGAHGAASESGPVMLADLTGQGAGGAAASLG